MSTPTIPDGAPVAPEQSPSPAPGAMKALTTKILAALAAIGLTGAVTEKADGAITITGMPNSTVSEPTLQPNAFVIEDKQFPSYQSSLRLQNRPSPVGTLTDGVIRYTLNLSALDVGSGGLLTISWDGQVMTGNSIGTPNNSGTAYAMNPYYVQQLTRWSKEEGGIPTVSPIATLNEHNTSGVLVPRTNDASGSLSSDEEIHLAQHFSVSVDITSAGTYDLDYVLQTMNTNGVATQNNLTLNFAPIPEADTALLAAAGAAALVFRRKRDGTIEKPETTTLNS